MRAMLSYCLYPKVYEEYRAHRKEYGYIMRMGSHVFFNGMALGETNKINIEDGKTLVIKYLGLGDLNEDGTRNVHFELNGMRRDVAVPDPNAHVQVEARPMADPEDKSQAGASIPGLVSKITVKPGDAVEENQIIAIIEAMKMETNVVARMAGTVDEVFVKEGATVNAGELRGGSPMDCAKAIGARIARPRKSVSQMQGLFRVLRPIPAVFAVPTTAGTGSETTIAAVVTEAAAHHKASMTDLCLMPRFAVLDPELTVGLPRKVTAATGMDALCHAVEAYTNDIYNSRLERELARKAVKLIYDNLYHVYQDGSDLKARQNLQKAAFYAGRAFTRGSVGYVHAIGHPLSGLYGTPHGLAMAILLPDGEQCGLASEFKLCGTAA